MLLKTRSGNDVGLFYKKQNLTRATTPYLISISWRHKTNVTVVYTTCELAEAADWKPTGSGNKLQQTGSMLVVQFSQKLRQQKPEL